MPFPPILRDSQGNPIPQIWDGTNWQPYTGEVVVSGTVTANQGNPGAQAWPVQLNGSNVELPSETVTGSYRKDGQGLGISRVYLESTLSANQDSVALGGPLAESLARKPIGQQKTLANNITVPAKAQAEDPTVSVTVLDIVGNIKIQSLHVLTRGGASGQNPILLLARYNSSGQIDPLQTFSQWGPASFDCQSYSNTIELFSHPMFRIKKIEGTDAEKVWELTSRPEHPHLDFPYGFRLAALNYSTESGYTVYANILYLQMP
jgi:hypothetical protein